MDLNTY